MIITLNGSLRFSNYGHKGQWLFADDEHIYTLTRDNVIKCIVENAFEKPYSMYDDRKLTFYPYEIVAYEGKIYRVLNNELCLICDTGDEKIIKSEALDDIEDSFLFIFEYGFQDMMALIKKGCIQTFIAPGEEAARWGVDFLGDKLYYLTYCTDDKVIHDKYGYELDVALTTFEADIDVIKKEYSEGYMKKRLGELDVYDFVNSESRIWVNNCCYFVMYDYSKKENKVYYMDAEDKTVKEISYKPDAYKIAINEKYLAIIYSGNILDIIDIHTHMSKKTVIVPVKNDPPFGVEWQLEKPMRSMSWIDETRLIMDYWDELFVLNVSDYGWINLTEIIETTTPELDSYFFKRWRTKPYNDIINKEAKDNNEILWDIPFS